VAVVVAAVDHAALAAIAVKAARRNTYQAYCAMSIRP
ncbi:MAG: hypothetical protein JWR14_1524, partial [Caballeronia sp.]|nr:hypothetical protein [Caballeronia sp.]